MLEVSFEKSRRKRPHKVPRKKCVSNVKMRNNVIYCEVDFSHRDQGQVAE